MAKRPGPRAIAEHSRLIAEAYARLAEIEENPGDMRVAARPWQIADIRLASLIFATPDSPPSGSPGCRVSSPEGTPAPPIT